MGKQTLSEGVVMKKYFYFVAYTFIQNDEKTGTGSTIAYNCNKELSISDTLEIREAIIKKDNLKNVVITFYKRLRNHYKSPINLKVIIIIILIGLYFWSMWFLFS